MVKKNPVRLLPPLKKAAYEHDQLIALINSMADGVISTNEKGNITLYNGAALNILDNNSTIDNRPIGSVLELYDKDNKPVNATQLVISTKTQFVSRDFTLHYDDSSIVNIYLSIAPVRQSFGKITNGGFVLILRDITREKSLEEERDEFISVISHELRTPVAIAEGNLSNARFIIEKTTADPMITSAIKQSHEQVLFLSGLINDLSTLSRAENNTLDLAIGPINVVNLVEGLVENYQPSAKEKGLSIRSELDSNLEVLQSSPLYVREVLQNFITNSIKYTDTGHVIIGAKAERNGVLFSINDTGIGISKTDQELIFNKFFRSEDYRTRKSNGTGIGLYVTRKLAKLLGAEIHVKSALNHGSTFSIFIPSMHPIS
jgi:signal transduction histidine kinase